MSFVPVAKCGLSRVGACHHSVRNGPAPTSLARREHRLLGLCVDNAHSPQDLGGHGRRQPEPDQDLREPAPAQASDLDLSRQVAKRLLIHGAPPVRSRQNGADGGAHIASTCPGRKD